MAREKKMTRAEICLLGAQVLHDQGYAHEWTGDEARQARRNGLPSNWPVLKSRKVWKAQKVTKTGRLIPARWHYEYWIGDKWVSRAVVWELRKKGLLKRKVS